MQDMFFNPQVVNLSQALQEADHYPNIRLFTAFQVQSDTPLDELEVVEQPWSVASSSKYTLHNKDCFALTFDVV